jgi:LysR family glycine cleavage system transcriptional activator
VRFVLLDGEHADFTEANLDLAVRWAEGPGELEGVPLGEPLRVTVGEGPWIAWPGDQSPAADDEGGGEDAALLTVGDAGQALAAAATGLGRTRVPLLLAQRWLDDGRLAAAGAPEPSRRGYWLVAPLPQWRQKKVKALVAHLTGQG